MMSAAKDTFTNKKLQLAFAALIILIFAIGAIGIIQIRTLSQRVENLGKRYLQLAKAVLEMRVNNTIYAMGIRNYIFWRTSRYLGAVPAAVNLKNILDAGERFRQQLTLYQAYAYLGQQKEWAKQAEFSFDALSNLAQQILNIVDSSSGQPVMQGRIENLLMAFENHLYRLDDFLNNTMGKENLGAIERQILQTQLDQRRATLLLALALLCAGGIGILIAHSVYNQLDKERRHREELFNQLITLEERERQALSGALHDQMGQDLSGLKIYLGLVSQGLEKAVIASPSARNDEASLRGASPSSSLRGASEASDEAITLRKNVGECNKIVSGLIEKSHNIAFLLRPPDLDEVGLADSLEALLLEYKHLTNINYTYQRPPQELKFQPAHSILLYRITQELLNNMAKHSQAKNVEVKITQDEGRINFLYYDDGAGFDSAELKPQPHRRKEDKLRFGLASLKERVGLLNGEMSINSTPGKGTRISVELPVYNTSLRGTK